MHPCTSRISGVHPISGNRNYANFLAIEKDVPASRWCGYVEAESIKPTEQTAVNASTQPAVRARIAVFLFFGFAGIAQFAGCNNSSNQVQGVTVVVSPKTISVKTGQTQQFTATVSGTANTAVTWQVNSMAGGAAATGTISASGLYTPPAAPPNPATVTVSAVSQADPSKSDNASVTVTDGTAPSAPSSLTANVSGSQINLAWTASTDNVGVTQYQIQRCSGPACSPSTQVGTSNTNSFQDTGLAGSTSYSYRVSASDAANNVSGFSNTATAITGASVVAVSITPVRGGLTVTQKLSLTPTVTGDSTNAGVTWSFTSTGSTTGGIFSSPNSASGTPVTFTAPSGAGVVTVKATSVADVSQSASATIGVTDLAGVYTYHNDISRDGANAQEYALTPTNVASSFVKLFSCGVDGAVYAQPLWVANVAISGVKHNVLVAATEHDSLYAFDADASPCTTLWHANLIDNTHGGTAGEVPVPGVNVGGGAGDLRPEVGITGTPVIDSTTNTIYVVSKSENTGTSTFFQRLHAIDLLTGSEKFSGPASIDGTITVPGTGDGSSGGIVPFHVQNEHQRAGLALAGGVVYVAWASHEDTNPYHGWVMGFNASSLALQYKFNDSPNSYRGGIWMAGGAPAIDSSNNLYVITGNGGFDGTKNFGDSVLKLPANLDPTNIAFDFFTPSTQSMLDANDFDLGSGGAVVLVDLPSAPAGFQHLLIGGGKGISANGQVYLLDRTNLGQFNASDVGAKQIFAVGGPIFATPAFWQNRLYIAGSFSALMAFTLNTTTGQFTLPQGSQTSTFYGFPGPTPSISASGTTNGVVWALDNNLYCTPQSSGCGPAVLHAYDATNLNTELWNSSQSAANAAGNAVKFTVPTIANGKVYIGTRGNNAGGADNTTSTPGEIDVYGLKPN